LLHCINFKPSALLLLVLGLVLRVGTGLELIIQGFMLFLASESCQMCVVVVVAKECTHMLLLQPRFCSRHVTSDL